VGRMTCLSPLGCDCHDKPHCFNLSSQMMELFLQLDHDHFIHSLFTISNHSVLYICALLRKLLSKLIDTVAKPVCAHMCMEVYY